MFECHFVKLNIAFFQSSNITMTISHRMWKLFHQYDMCFLYCVFTLYIGVFRQFALLESHQRKMKHYLFEFSPRLFNFAESCNPTPIKPPPTSLHLRDQRATNVLEVIITYRLSIRQIVCPQGSIINSLCRNPRLSQMKHLYCFK